MKRFLIGIGVSIVLISSGSAMMLFELKDYRIVNSFVDIEDEVEEYETEVSRNDPLRIELDDDFDDDAIRYVIDDTLDDMVKIEVQESLDHKFSNNRLRVDDSRWVDIPFGKYINIFMDGLKDKKLYYYEVDTNDFEQITIHCSSKARDFIEIKY